MKSLKKPPTTTPAIVTKHGVVRFDRTQIMGIINVTPDSFFDGGRFFEPQKAAEGALQLAEEGADILDLGAESSRPGATAVDIHEEKRRLLPVLQAIRRQVALPISVDTRNPETALAALDEGADIINDIGGMVDPQMRAVAAQHQTPVIVMHMKGTPRTMQRRPSYGDVLAEIGAWFGQRVETLRHQGVDQILLDPGIGFGKTLEHNLTLIRYFEDFRKWNCPLLLGMSRKSFLGKITGALPSERFEGSLAVAALASYWGVDLIRVHDVRATRLAIAVSQAFRDFENEQKNSP